MKYALALIAVVSGCSKTNPYYCEDNPDHNCMLDAAGSGFDSESFRCTGPQDCSGATPACDLAIGACEPCTATDVGACSGAKPVCDGATDTCRACSANIDCASGACMADGTCAEASALLFAAPAAGASTCTAADKCSLEAAIAAADSTKKIIVLDSGTYAPTSTLAIGKTLTILGRDAIINRTSGTSGPVIDVTSGGNVTLLFATITNGVNASTGHGINCTTGSLTARSVIISGNDGNGINSTGCLLTVDRSTFTTNEMGAINISGTSETFSVTNSMFYKNGTQGSSFFGAVKIQVSAPSSTSHLEFNTMIDNYANSGSTSGGVVCDNFIAPHNIIVRNYNGSTPTAGNQAFGNCTYADSILQGDTTGVSFLHDSAPYNLRINADSTAKDASGVSSSGYDFEGDPRPQSGVDDIGADEYKP